MPAATASLLSCGTSVAEPSAASTTTAFSARPKTWPAETSLTTSRSQPLRASLVRAWVSTSASSSPVSAAKPTTSWPGVRLVTSSASTSGLRTSGTALGSAAEPFLSLVAAAFSGRKSATAALITTTSASAASASIAVRSSSAVPTGTTRTPNGTGRSTFAATSTTSAPRAAATRASAQPCLPEDRLPR